MDAAELCQWKSCAAAFSFVLHENWLNHTIIHQVQMRRIWRMKKLLIELKCDNTELQWVSSYSLDAGKSICPFSVHLLLHFSVTD